MGTNAQPRVFAIIGASLLMSALIMGVVAYILREQQIVVIILASCAALDVVIGLLLLLLGVRRMGASRPL